MRIEYVPLSKAVLWDRNPKAHDIGGICQSIREYGFRDPPAYDAALNAVVEGNGRIIALRMMHDQGDQPPRGIGAVGDTGEWAVPILFGVDASSKAAAEAYAVDHNNLTMLGGDFAVWDVARMWDDEYTAILRDLAEQGRSPVTVDGEDLDALLAGIVDETAAVDAAPHVDKAEELRQKWGVCMGQLWQLGEHRLLCGDSTRREDVERVMGGEKADMIFTDPPYGHNNNDGDLIHNREKALGRPQTPSSVARPIANDSPEEAARVYSAFLAIANDLLKPGCCCCCCCGGGGPDPQFARWALEMDKAIGFKHAVVWDKGGLGMGWHYRRCYEFVLVAEKPGKASHWFGGNDVPNVIRDVSKIIPSSANHPTEKPTNLPAWFLKLHSTSGDTVYEPFAGYGSTVMACHNLNRRCRAIEIDPGYCAVTLQRWADATGGTPELLE